MITHFEASRECYGFTSDINAFALHQKLRKELQIDIKMQQLPHRLVTVKGYRQHVAEIGSLHGQLQPYPTDFLKGTVKVLRTNIHDTGWITTPIWFTVFGASEEPDFMRRYGNVYRLARQLDNEHPLPVVIHQEILNADKQKVEQLAQQQPVYVENGFGPSDREHEPEEYWNPKKIKQNIDGTNIGTVLDVSTFARARRDTKIADKSISWAFETLKPQMLHFQDGKEDPNRNSLFIEGLVPGEGQLGDELKELLEHIRATHNDPIIVIEVDPQKEKGPIQTISEGYNWISRYA